MFTYSAGPYVVLVAEDPYVFFGREALLVDRETASEEGTPLVLTVTGADDGKALLHLERRYLPGRDSGFHPGAALVEETDLLFVGAGEWLAAYALDPPRKLWEDRTWMGFGSWKRHGDVVLMSGELELAAWDLHGNKLWARFVEPPWDYTVEAGTVQLDVMGEKTAFPLREGPRD